MAVSGWQSAPKFWDKTDFLVVVLGIPIIAAVLAIGWRIVKPNVQEVTDGRLKAVWSDDGPGTYGADVSPDDLDRRTGADALRCR